MKQFKMILGIAMIAMVGIFTACEEDETATIDITPKQANPDTVVAGTEVTLEFSVITDENIETIELQKNGGQIDLKEENFNSKTSDTYTYKDTLAKSNEAGTSLSMELIVTDSKDNNKTHSFSIYVKEADAPAGPIKSFTAILMGAQDNADYGSALDAYNNNVYFISGDEDKNNSSDIDLLYYYGGSNYATIVAPDDETVTGGSNDFTWTDDWGTKNPTRFMTSDVTVSEFDNMDDDSEISTLSGMDKSKITNLSIDDIIAFKTANEKKGLIKVVDLDENSSGTIKIDVKIQE